MNTDTTLRVNRMNAWWLTTFGILSFVASNQISPDKILHIKARPVLVGVSIGIIVTGMRRMILSFEYE